MIIEGFRERVSYPLSTAVVLPLRIEDIMVRDVRYVQTIKVYLHIKGVVMRQKRWLELMKDYNGEILYHPEESQRGGRYL